MFHDNPDPESLMMTRPRPFIALEQFSVSASDISSPFYLNYPASGWRGWEETGWIIRIHRLSPFFIQAVEFARNFCGLADSVLQDAVLSAECAYMVDVYGVDFLEFIYAEGRLPDEVCTFLGACP